MRERLGFVSMTGAVAAAAALILVTGWTAVAGPVLFSPGDLNAVSRGRVYGGVSSHAQLKDCGACHTPFWSGGTMAQACLACHADVAGQLQSSSGLHGKLVGGAASPTCGGCHTDHHGPNAALTVADNSFPHDLTGYSLAGHRLTAKGAAISCVDCHASGIGQFDQATCTSCHQSLNSAFMTTHLATFGPPCLTCHDGSGRFGSDFNHDKLPFQLTGKHASVACAQCHPNAKSIQDFRNTPQDCYSCHAKNDKHNGTFGKQCGGCHNTTSWANATFDHSIFPVNHGTNREKSTCQTCHPSNLSTYTCFGCHAHTPANVVGEHEGRSAASLTDCIKCHAGGRVSD